MRGMQSILVCGLALHTVSAHAQQLITPEQAVASVRSFLGEGTAPFVVQKLRDDGPESRYGKHYDVRAKDGSGRSESFFVRASDGMVLLMSSPGRGPRLDPETPPTLTLEQATTIARQFVARCAPDLMRRRWQLAPEQYLRNGRVFNIIWMESFGSHGAVSSHDMWLKVDGVTGEVLLFVRPPDFTLMAPTQPQITLDQAKRIAAPFKLYDEADVPFNEVWLQVQKDPFGIQRLRWHIRQMPNLVPGTTEENFFRKPFGVEIDALTGEIVSFDVPLSAGPGRVPTPPRRAVPIALRLASEPKSFTSYAAPPQMMDGALWVRAELLRGLGARVEASPKQVEVRSGDRRVKGGEVGARWKDWGWWVPLRATAAKLGWRVEWMPAQRQAVLRAVGGKAEAAQAVPVARP
jgi:hypothetical protein